MFCRQKWRINHDRAHPCSPHYLIVIWLQNKKIKSCCHGTHDVLVKGWIRLLTVLKVLRHGMEDPTWSDPETPEILRIDHYRYYTLRCQEPTRKKKKKSLQAKITSHFVPGAWNGSFLTQARQGWKDQAPQRRRSGICRHHLFLFQPISSSEMIGEWEIRQSTNHLIGYLIWCVVKTWSFWHGLFHQPPENLQPPPKAPARCVARCATTPSWPRARPSCGSPAPPSWSTPSIVLDPHRQRPVFLTGTNQLNREEMVLRNVGPENLCGQYQCWVYVMGSMLIPLNKCPSPHFGPCWPLRFGCCPPFSCLPPASPGIVHHKFSANNCSNRLEFCSDFAQFPKVFLPLQIAQLARLSFEGSGLRRKSSFKGRASNMGSMSPGTLADFRCQKVEKVTPQNSGFRTTQMVSKYPFNRARSSFLAPCSSSVTSVPFTLQSDSMSSPWEPINSTHGFVGKF